jgi:predicted helicase
MAGRKLTELEMNRNRKQYWDDGQELTCWSKELRKEYWKVKKPKS